MKWIVSWQNIWFQSKKIAELTEIKDFLQSLITEDDHQAADCKTMAQLKPIKCGLKYQKSAY